MNTVGQILPRRSEEPIKQHELASVAGLRAVKLSVVVPVRWSWWFSSSLQIMIRPQTIGHHYRQRHPEQEADTVGNSPCGLRPQGLFTALRPQPQ
ncbi:hypothetical protein ABZ330_29460 [Streptomyces sp. NPDC006172]|uniref:hypothetical protein n=1 Tax=Streptomyces sp. NPDC006172 TaxID=3154470 RepID=UPI003401114B